MTTHHSQSQRQKKSKAKYGQHFLSNQSIAKKIVNSFLPVSGPIIEIGPGKGVLTHHLVKSCQGNRITVIEIDPQLIAGLESQFGHSVKVVNQDILKNQLEELFPAEMVNLIGNIPYYISKELMDWILSQRTQISKGIFMMQKEFVDKILIRGKNNRINAQSLFFNGVFKCKKVGDVQPGSFSPPPKVKSSIFLFEPKPENFGPNISPDDFYTFLKKCFYNRRKTLINNLSQYFPMQKLTDGFSKLNLNTQTRAEELKLETFIQLGSLLFFV